MEHLATKESIIRQITDVYLNHEHWHTKKLPLEDALLYHEHMLERGNLVYTVAFERILLGYAECLRVNFEQWGRIVCHAPFYSFDENTTDGNVCVLHNVWIRPDYRNSFVLENLRSKFFKANAHCEYFAGIALRKKTQPIKVFERAKLEKLVARMSSQPYSRIRIYPLEEVM